MSDEISTLSRALREEAKQLRKEARTIHRVAICWSIFAAILIIAGAYVDFRYETSKIDSYCHCDSAQLYKNLKTCGSTYCMAK